MDALGSTRLITNEVGVPQVRYDYLPFGQDILPPSSGGRADVLCGLASCYGQSDASSQQFTGKEHDSETGLDYFIARYYSSPQGRFTGADLPLVDQYPSDPQSWNLYGYVRNSPLVRVDRDGHSSHDCAWDPKTNTLTCPGDPLVGIGGAGPRFPLNTVQTEPPRMPPRPLPQAPFVRVSPSESQGHRARTQQEYDLCVAQAESRRNSALLRARTEQLIGGVHFLAGFAVMVYAAPQLSAMYFGSSTIAGRLHGIEAVAHTGGFAYGGLLSAAAVPGYLYGVGTLGVSDAWNEYYGDVTACAGAVP
jgi:RHS repeat-associated protein